LVFKELTIDQILGMESLEEISLQQPSAGIPGDYSAPQLDCLFLEINAHGNRSYAVSSDHCEKIFLWVVKSRGSVGLAKGSPKHIFIRLLDPYGLPEQLYAMRGSGISLQVEVVNRSIFEVQ